MSYQILRPSMQTYIARTLALISPYTALNYKKVRVGGVKDGGYVMLDDLDRVRVCYSLGVGPDVTWDDDMAGRGAVIYQYDHTVEAPPSKHENFRFFKIGITHDQNAAPEMREINNLLAENNHAAETNMLLKIDIEGHEWEVFANLELSVLAKFSQIVVEFHGLSLLDQDDFRERADRVFRKMNSTHRVVHVHGNNFGGLHIVEGVAIADVIELTFASRALYDFGPCSEVFPTVLDAPCNPHEADLLLGTFQFA